VQPIDSQNSLAILVRVMEQALRDGIIDRNPARITGWQREYQRAEDELDDPRALALPDWPALTALAEALVARSADHFPGWATSSSSRRAPQPASVRSPASGPATSIPPPGPGLFASRPHPAPGGLIDKGTKGKRARAVPLITEVRELATTRIAAAERNPDARLFTGPRGGRITTAVLRDATHWDEVGTTLGYEHLRRHDLRHTGSPGWPTPGFMCTS
jgi:hypothetical protein